jgi:uncharacterized coiled-coil protein SlyX
MEVSPEEIVRIPTVVLDELMKKVRKQSRVIRNLNRLVTTLNETIERHNLAWGDLYDKVAEMSEEIGVLNENMGNHEPQPQEETDIHDILSDAMTDDQVYSDLLDISS